MTGDLGLANQDLAAVRYLTGRLGRNVGGDLEDLLTGATRGWPEPEPEQPEEPVREKCVDPSQGSGNALVDHRRDELEYILRRSVGL